MDLSLGFRVWGRLGFRGFGSGGSLPVVFLGIVGHFC